MVLPRSGLSVLLIAGFTGCGGSSGKPPEPAVVLTSCNPLAQTGCSTGKKCTWLRTTSSTVSQTGALACTPPGTVAEGGACRYGADGATTGYDDCKPGLQCQADTTVSAASGICARICDNAHVTSCAPSASWACSSFSDYFAQPSAAPTAGLCEPQCNPLTQVRLTDGAAACGSPNPAMPTRGCYGLPAGAGEPSVFTCANAGPGNMTSDAVISTNYLNACAPGYIPLLTAATGSSAVICVAFCQPANTTLESHPTPGGVTPHSCADAGAGGTHECRFWWSAEDPAAVASTWSNGLGYCMDYTRYTYTSGGSMPQQDPSCTTLSGTVVPPATTSAAADWGCVAQ